MWLIKSSIGRKVVMSVTGIALILFLTFHASMNVVALFSYKGYNMICEFLGANWYAVVWLPWWLFTSSTPSGSPCRIARHVATTVML